MLRAEALSFVNLDLILVSGVWMEVHPNTSSTIKQLEVIVKVSERCNIACTYCYYFFGGDESYLDRPANMKLTTFQRAIEFLAEGASELGVEDIKIVFHGGEPLMWKKSRFAEAVEIVRSELSECKYSLHVQTNGVLIDHEWMDFFVEQNIDVGISIDGGRDENDRFRLDRRGRSAHDSIEGGTKIALEVAGSSASILSVLNADFDYTKVYSYFVDSLGARSLNFLLPDCSHADGIPENHTAEDYGRALCDIYDEWTKNDEVYVREIHNLLDRISQTTSLHATSPRNPILIIQSDGAINIDDSYIPALSWRERFPPSNVFGGKLSEWLKSDAMREIGMLYSDPPTPCRSCEWLFWCRGGDLENRFDGHGFDRDSVYCDGLKIFYGHVAKHLARSGYPVDKLVSSLNLPAG